MARPLREQLVLTTLALLVPLVAIITWSGSVTYHEQLLAQIDEANSLSRVFAAFFDRVGGKMDDAELAEIVKTSNVRPGTAVQLLDDNGHVLANYAEASRGIEEMSVGEARMKTRPLKVTVGLPTIIAWNHARPIYQNAILLAGGATLLVFLIEIGVVRRWLRALRRLSTSADRIGGGDLTTPAKAAMPARELEHLQDALRGMVDRLRDAHEAIARQVAEERRMREEVESLQKQVIRQERLAAIGVLISGIAHELNNPLQAISGHAELLERQANVPPDVRSDLNIIKKESARASAIIRNLSRFGRVQSSNPSPIKLSDVVASVLELRQRRFDEQDIAVVLDEQSAQPAMVVFTELQQVLLNFVINAEQAIADGPEEKRRIVIRTRDVDRQVRLEVEDSGPGVPVEDEPKLFQPFFTTKPVGQGTGLGLSVSYGIIRSYGGKISYRRGNGGGAVFWFELPAFASSPVRAN